VHTFIKNGLTKRSTTILLRTALILSASLTSHLLSANPLLVNDSELNQATLIGTVFIDSNSNGYLDDGEQGIPGVRIASVTGLVLETDAYGRFHIPDGSSNDVSFAQKQLLKVDSYSLPQGARLTTENPRLLRPSNGGLNKINFGVVF